MATAAYAARPTSDPMKVPGSPSSVASTTAARTTPVTSCTTLQPSMATSVGWSVVRRRLRVMLTMTTDEDRAMARPMTTAATGSSPSTRTTAAVSSVVMRTCSGAAQAS